MQDFRLISFGQQGFSSLLALFIEMRFDGYCYFAKNSYTQTVHAVIIHGVQSISNQSVYSMYLTQCIQQLIGIYLNTI